MEPASTRSTRLIARGRAVGSPTPLAAAFSRVVFEPAHHVMERRMLLNIKALAEGRVTSKAADNATVALWTLCIVLLVASLVEVARRRRWQRPLLVAGAAALVYQLLTLVQPSPFLGAALVASLAAALWWRERDERERATQPVTSSQVAASLAAPAG
jgi:hypothetical protein